MAGEGWGEDCEVVGGECEGFDRGGQEEWEGEEEVRLHCLDFVGRIEAWWWNGGAVEGFMWMGAPTIMRSGFHSRVELRDWGVIANT